MGLRGPCGPIGKETKLKPNQARLVNNCQSEATELITWFSQPMGYQKNRIQTFTANWLLSRSLKQLYNLVIGEFKLNAIARNSINCQPATCDIILYRGWDTRLFRTRNPWNEEVYFSRATTDRFVTKYSCGQGNSQDFPNRVNGRCRPITHRRVPVDVL